MSIYDGPNSTSPLIGQYCGQQRNLVVYSTENYLYVTFDTLPRTANTQNRGFKGMFEFSESFVKLGKFLSLYYFGTMSNCLWYCQNVLLINVLIFVLL